MFRLPPEHFEPDDEKDQPQKLASHCDAEQKEISAMCKQVGPDHQADRLAYVEDKADHGHPEAAVLRCGYVGEKGRNSHVVRQPAAYIHAGQ